MHCPGYRQGSLGYRDRVLAAVRAETRCPACGIAIRFGFWPRLAHVIFGDAVLVGGVVGALWWQVPFLIPLSASSWILATLLLPIEPDIRDPATRTIEHERAREEER